MTQIQRAMAVGCGLLLAAVGAWAQSPILREIESSFVRLHEEVGPSVVNIESRGPVEESAADISEHFRYFGIPVPDGEDDEEARPRPDSPRSTPGPQTPRPRATGSGFVYSKEGYIVTNNHVVDSAETIIVRLHNLNEYRAEVVGTDPETDIAVLKIEADEELIPARLGDSDELKVGMFAIAIGSPRGFEGSVSFGHISALGREQLEGLSRQGLLFQNMIQTDAAINLGNSGGPLCSITGEVIGMNTAILWGANSIGFAIPINTAKFVVPALIADGKVIRGFLGVEIKSAREAAAALDMPDGMGALVEHVVEGSAAEDAGIRTYDVIRSVNGTKVTTENDLIRRVSSFPPGTSVTLEIWRDNSLIETTATLGERPDRAQIARGPAREQRVLGMLLSELTSEVAERLGLDSETKGVLITNVRPDSPAEEAGLTHGDIITEVAQQPVTSVRELRDLLEEIGTPGKALLVRYMRGGRQSIIVLEVPKED